jgi:hypothetical protein
MTTVFEGQLRKMQFNNLGNAFNIKPEYYLLQNDNKLVLNNLIGKTIQLEYSGQINCIACGRITKKSFAQGYCYPCFVSVPQTEECVLRPELCRAHEGIARNMEFAKENCLVDQFVYIALSGGLKVGVTRHHQIPTRWVDQGANKAIKLLVAKNRYTAGLIEVALKKILADKTNWRKMLMGNDENRPLQSEKEAALSYLKELGYEFAAVENDEYTIEYPIVKFPTKIVSKDLEKEPIMGGLLAGIKGQYLIFDGGIVINLRKHTGFNITIGVV